MLLTPLLAIEALEDTIVTNNLDNFTVYETLKLDVIYRWGNSKNISVGFKITSKHDMITSLNFDSKLKKITQEPANSLIDTYGNLAKMSMKLPDFLITQS